jgi:hypothetical protein
MVNEAASRYPYEVRPAWARVIQEKDLPFRPFEVKGNLARKGAKHERKAHQLFTELYELSYVPSVWFKYDKGRDVGYCQLDGLLALHKQRTLVIVECKFRHTSEAFWQTHNLYLPVVRAWLGDEGKQFWTIAICEVVHWYDPSTQFPTRPILVDRLELVRPDRFSVHILRS